MKLEGNLMKKKWFYNLYLFCNMNRRYLFKRFDLHGPQTNLSCNPFFIVGSGRSGNTLLRAILSQKKEVVIPPESYVWGEIIRKYNMISCLEWKDVCKFVISTFQSNQEHYTWELDFTPLYQKTFNLPEKDRTLAKLFDEIYMYYAQNKKPTAKIWGDKTPLNTFSLGWINRVFPKGKFIHILRDARDVVNSYVQSGIYDDVAAASDRWLNSVETIERFRKNVPGRFFEVRYEDLVSDPEPTTKALCDFLGFEYDHSMLGFSKDVSKLGDTKHDHHQNLKKPISTNSIGKWKRELKENQINEIKRVCGDKLRELSYMQ